MGIKLKQREKNSDRKIETDRYSNDTESRTKYGSMTEFMEEKQQQTTHKTVMELLSLNRDLMQYLRQSPEETMMEGKSIPTLEYLAPVNL